MQYHDRVYGEVAIADPVVLELISDPAIQRLKGIDQAGYRPLWIYPDADITSEEFSRYSHSLGVFVLLRKYGASLEEQIAGLLHDVSHSAFSHCIDYALSHRSGAIQDHQDEYFLDYIQQTNIPNILTKHGYDPTYIFDEKNFPLLERPLPDLCADRIDYALRNAEAFEKDWPRERITELLQKLVVRDSRWIFTDVRAARVFAELFRHLNNTYFASFLGAVMLQTVGDYLAYALDKKYIIYDDLYTTDQQVLNTIKPHHQSDGRLTELFQRMNNRERVSNNPDEYGRAVVCKSRIVDPYCMRDGIAVKLSNVEPAWLPIVRQEMEPKKYFLKFT